MRLFTNISFLSTLVALFAAAFIALVAVNLFQVPYYLLIFLVPITCIAYFLSMIIAHFISSPLRDLVAKSHAYRNGDKSVRFEATGTMREVDELAVDIDQFTRIYEIHLNELTTLKARQNEFVSDVAHEFRTPLTAISGNAELMLDPDMPQATREHFCEIILEESERLKKLTNQLLVLQHVEEGGPTTSLERLNIEPIAHDVVDMLGPIAQEKGVTLSVEGAALDILGNRDQLKQALINLVDNAIRHTDAGGHVRVVLSGLKDQSVVAVRDDGCGIGAVDPQLLFKRFYRTDSSRARNSGGAGLGLAIVKEIVEGHDGSVTAFNAPEGGAVFAMTFPAVKELRPTARRTQL